MMEADLASERAVRLEVGVAIAGYLGSFVAALEVEMRACGAVPAIQADLDGAEFDLATVMIEPNVSRSEHVDVVGVPAFDLQDAPTAEHC